MDPHERFYRRSLRDVLVSQGVLAQDQAEELVVSARDAHEPFGCVVVDAGYLSAWDLAKTLAAAYQMPVLPLLGYKFDTTLQQADLKIAEGAVTTAKTNVEKAKGAAAQHLVLDVRGQVRGETAPVVVGERLLEGHGIGGELLGVGRHDGSPFARRRT